MRTSYACETSWHLPEAPGHSPKATGSVHKLRINRPYFIMSVIADTQ